MRIDSSIFKSAIDKVTILTSGDKQIPGIMFRPIKLDGDEFISAMDVCYSDGHKSLIETIPVTGTNGDNLTNMVVEYEAISKLIKQMQSTGSIKIGEIVVDFIENQIMRFSATQFLEITDESGNVTDARQLGKKTIDVAWIAPDSNLKASILNRMKYENIFNIEGTADEYSRDELVSALARTSAEKGRNIYISANVQSVFVANQAHVTCVPVSPMDEPSEEEKNIIIAELSEAGNYNEQTFEAELQKRRNRVHQSVVIAQPVAKAIVGILQKCDSEKVLVHRTDNKYCNLVIENDNEKVGIWFEMSTASKAHIGSLEKYSALDYKSYQVMFIREFLDNNIKSAMESAKNDKNVIKFEDTTLENPTVDLDLVISGTNYGASVVNSYRVNPDNIVDPTGDIKDKQFNISLKVFADMLAQLKTEYVALDFNVDASGTTCIRLAEIDTGKFAEEYRKARVATEELCKQKGVEFDPTSTPTPVELRLDFRANTLLTKQYTILAKS